jgi:hypothetical protein
MLPAVLWQYGIHNSLAPISSHPQGRKTAMGFGFVAVVACLVLTVAYLCWAEVAVAWKALVVLLYIATWYIDRFIHTPIPIGFLMQIALCFYYLLYFKIKGS